MDSGIIEEGALGLLAQGHRGVEAYRSKKWTPFKTEKKPSKRRVLLIGWDAAEWQVINPLLDSGKMPALESLVNNGTIGNIATLDPPLSPILWTSIATGKRPYKHGVLGFTEGLGEGRLGPVTNKSRKVKAVWNMLNQQDLKTHVVGWWPSHPAEDLNGIQVSNFYGKVKAETKRSTWKMNRGTVSPAGLRPTFRDLRFHPEEIKTSHILPFVPNAHLIDQEKDNKLQHIVKYLCETISVQSAATWILENEDWDFMGIYFDAIDHFSHVFMKYHPPKLGGVQADKYELYKDVMNGIYIFHDMMLEHLLKYTDEQTHVIVLSDHGFYADHRRLLKLPKEPAAIAREHNPLGVAVLKGPGIKKDERIYGASLLDIAPTVLHMFDQPIGLDMDGKVLSQVFENGDQQVNNIPSWEDETTRAVLPSGDYEVDSDTLQQLVDLGYIDDKVTESPEMVAKQLDEQDFYLARAYIDGNHYEEAISILEDLTRKYPENNRYHKFIADCYLNLSDVAKLKGLKEKLEGLENKPANLIDYIAISIEMMQNRYKTALKKLLVFEKDYGRSYSTSKRIAKCHLNTDQPDDALARFEKLLKKNSTDKEVLYLMGVAYMRKAEYENAVSYLLDTLSIHYYFPMAHFCLGECFYAMERYDDCARAWEMSRKLFPGFIRVRKKLKQLYENELNDPEKAEALAISMDQLERETIYIVSGLPRSGTSMLMQILEAGGMELLVDDVRSADENNKKGYYEFAAVKSIKKNNRFLKRAEGKAVKVILPLLKFLPANYQYKIIVIKRDLNEVLDSQYKMLHNLGKIKENTSSLMVEHNFKKSLEEIDLLQDRENFEVLEVSFDSLIRGDDSEFKRICDFTSLDDVNGSMKSVVDRNLYRSIKVIDKA